MRIRLPLALAAALLIPACGEDPGPAPPTKPFSLSAPADAAVDLPVRPAFSWTASRHASSYRLEIATDAAFLNVALDQAGITTTNFTPGSDLARKTDHWWRVTVPFGTPA